MLSHTCYDDTTDAALELKSMILGLLSKADVCLPSASDFFVMI